MLHSRGSAQNTAAVQANACLAAAPKQMVSMWTTCSTHGGKGYVHGRKRGEVIWLKVKEKNMLASNIDNKNLTRSARSSFFNNLLK